MEGSGGVDDRELIDLAKLVDVEAERVAGAAVDANLKIVGQAVVDLSDIIFWGKVVANALLQLSRINRIIQQHGIGLFSVSSGTSRLLEIGFDGVGTINVHHKAHVRFVDAHAKRIRGHHDAYMIIHPFFLPHVFGEMLQPRMIGGGCDVVFL